MQAGLFQPLEMPPALSLGDFLEALIHSLEQAKIRPCILRNYEGFPERNVGGDVDFLIHPTELPRAILALQAVAGIRIVGYTRLSYVASLFVEGVSGDAGNRCIQVDFFLNLGWKGLPYLEIDVVMRRAELRHAGHLRFWVPCDVHKSIISLFNGLLVSSYLKEKYFPCVQQTFAKHRDAIIAELQPQFGRATAVRLTDAVIGGERSKILGCVRGLRNSLALRSLLRRPGRSSWNMARYALGVVRLCRPFELSETVYLMGPDDATKTQIVATLKPLLKGAVKCIETGAATRRYAARNSWQQDVAGSTNIPAVSIPDLMGWITAEWSEQLFGTRKFTLHIVDRSFDELLINPQKLGYIGPMWFAKLVGTFFPAPEIRILLDAPCGTHLRDIQNLAPAAQASGTEAYRSFVKSKKRHLILDSDERFEQLVASTYSAIVEVLAARATAKLRRYSLSCA